MRGESEAAFDVGDELRVRRFEADLPHRVFEEQPVFRLLDGVDFGADQFDAVAIEHAGFGQFDGEVEGGLSADGGEQGVGAFLRDDLFEIGRGSAARRRCGRPVPGSVMMVAGLELTRMTS